jgi:glycosyltransferase involved in cell wall biosynthesis
VVYYASYLPLHGVDIVVKAAALLQDAPIRFRLIGGGLKFDQVKRLAQEFDLQNVEFVPEMPIEELAEEIAAADICLGGHFGATAKAARVIPGKVYQILAMARPLIATTTPANLELLKHGLSAYLCPPNDPEALAQAIYHLSEDKTLSRRLAQSGYELYQERCSEAVVTRLLQDAVAQLVKA